jgi:DNA-binding NtrC family response regulator
MAQQMSQPDIVNVLLNNADWAWPQAVRDIFQPRGVNALVADSCNDIVRIVTNNKIHLALLDMSQDDLSMIHTLKIIRKHDRLLPCILLTGSINDTQLSQVLALNVFTVVNKPVDLHLLIKLMHRLFQKCYASDIFSPDFRLGNRN